MTEYNKLLRMAKEYGVEKNALFLSLLDSYIVQKRTIDMIGERLEKVDLTVEKQYVKNGSRNQYLNPVIKDLPKHADILNKTAKQLMDVIKQFGSEREADDPLTNFIEG